MKTMTMILTLLLAGCATLGGLRDDDPLAGSGRLFVGADFAEVVDRTLLAVGASGLTLEASEEVQPGVYMFLASAGAGAFTHGERVRVMVDGVARPGDVTVYVHTKRKLATTVFSESDWGPRVFAGLLVDGDPGVDIVPPCSAEDFMAGRCDRVTPGTED